LALLKTIRLLLIRILIFLSNLKLLGFNDILIIILYFIIYLKCIFNFILKII
jgi:hypothetical protein